MLPALLCQPQPGSRCICRGKSSGCPAEDRHYRGQRSPPAEGEEAREWPSALGLARPHPPWSAGSGPHLAEGRPLFLALGTEALVGVCVSEEYPHGAKLVEQPQADARGVPEPHRAVLVPVGGTGLRQSEGCRAGTQPSGLCPHPARPTRQEESAIGVTYPVSSRSLCGGAGARLVPPSMGHSWRR